MQRVVLPFLSLWLCAGRLHAVRFTTDSQQNDMDEVNEVFDTDEMGGETREAKALYVNLVNACDRPLTITGRDGSPHVGVLHPGESLTQVPAGSSGRYQAYWSASHIGQLKYGLFEYSVCPRGLCCNPSNVDLFTVPLTIKCAANGQTTGCTNNPNASVLRAALANCPTARPEFGSVSDSEFCYSAGYACSVNSGAPRCGSDANSPMQRSMRKFGGFDSSANAYGCAGNFSQDASACAKVNRGVSDPRAHPSTYYKLYEDGVPLFNEYNKWLHEMCGADDYAFPYDDKGEHGGYQECPGDVTVTFCSAALDH